MFSPYSCAYLCVHLCVAYLAKRPVSLKYNSEENLSVGVYLNFIVIIVIQNEQERYYAVYMVQVRLKMSVLLLNGLKFLLTLQCGLYPNKYFVCCRGTISAFVVQPLFFRCF
jgi:hypothetical protein